MKESNYKFAPPDGLTVEQVAEILERTSKKIVYKNKSYIFGYNSDEDIIQHGIYEGLKCIARGKYKPELFIRDDRDNSPESCLERFMSVHIKNRLINYKRDHSRRNVENSYPANEAKYSLMHPAQLDEHLFENNQIKSIDIIYYHETLVKIKRELSRSPDLLNDFYRIIDGVNIPQQRKTKLKEKIRDILDAEEKIC